MSCFGFPSKEVKRRLYEKERQFVQCVVRVDHTKEGWHKSERKLVRAFHETARHFTYADGDELIELSGQAVRARIEKIIGKSKNRLRLEWIQAGLCCTVLYGQHDRSKFLPPPPPVEKSALPEVIFGNTGGYPEIIMGNTDGYPVQTYNYPTQNYYGYHRTGGFNTIFPFQQFSMM